MSKKIVQSSPTQAVIHVFTLGGQDSFFINKPAQQEQQKRQPQIQTCKTTRRNIEKCQKSKNHSKHTNNTKLIHIPGKLQHHDPKQDQQTQHNRFQHQQSHHNRDRTQKNAKSIKLSL